MEEGRDINTPVGIVGEAKGSITKVDRKGGESHKLVVRRPLTKGSRGRNL